ncbi:MAG: hypothetical protein NT026_00455 [Candidatus Staskawiczbacteria bacterium]|nr:hypothetical protein [Candidatus Staskawiczbacteria bacterium]
MPAKQIAIAPSGARIAQICGAVRGKVEATTIATMGNVMSVRRQLLKQVRRIWRTPLRTSHPEKAIIAPPIASKKSAILPISHPPKKGFSFNTTLSL